MDLYETVVGVISWLLVLGAALWWVKRKKHPARSLLPSYLAFCGVLCGSVLVGLFAVLSAWYALGMWGQDMPATVGGLFAMAFIFPAWWIANKAISAPPKNQ